MLVTAISIGVRASTEDAEPTINRDSEIVSHWCGLRVWWDGCARSDGARLDTGLGLDFWAAREIPDL